MNTRTLHVVAFTLALAAVPILSAAAEPPAEPAYVTNFGDKAPVLFDHGQHSGVDCARCHHNAQQAQADQEQVFRCGQCHGQEAAQGAPNLKDAMHHKDTGVCTSCHLGAEPQAKKLKCADCHVKR